MISHIQQWLFALFLLFPFTVSIAQNASTSDCLGAIPVCEFEYIETDSPEGIGNVSELSHFHCTSGERNSTWYSFTVNNTGKFGFVLCPQNPEDDYDWCLFNITNASCEDLYFDPSLVVSCNAAGGPNCLGCTGATGSNEFDIQGFNCGNFPPTVDYGYSTYNDLVDVIKGNTYVLCVNNYSNSPYGYTINFGGNSSEVGIVDEIKPELATVYLPKDCFEKNFIISFSEPIQCATIASDNFYLDGPDGPYNLSLSSTQCDSSGNFDKRFLLSVRPPLEPGDYILYLETDGETEVLDLCGNAALSDGISFSTEDYDIIDLGSDTTLCVGQTLELTGTDIGENLWQDGFDGEVYHVVSPGEYSVTISNECGIDADTILVEYVSELPPLNLGQDTSLCQSDTLILNVEHALIDYYRWDDGSTEPERIITEGGEYAVTVSNSCGDRSDELIAEYLLPIETYIVTDTFVCPGESIWIDLSRSSAQQFLWEDGSSVPLYKVESPGIYQVDLQNHCEFLKHTIYVSECEICNIYLPNVFSPNRDGLNDHFKVISDCDLFDFELQIFNRWGSLVFQSNQTDELWDGSFNGKDAPMEVYTLVLKCTVFEDKIARNIIKASDLLLIR